MTAQDWLAGVDIELGLTEIRDDTDEIWTRRALAGASVGVQPELAHHWAAELAQAINRMVDGQPAGKTMLAMILSRRGRDYQRCLWFTVAGRDPYAVCADINWLVHRLATRAEIWRRYQAQGATRQEEPYIAKGAEGPPARFSQAFELGRHWQGIAEGVQ